MALRCRLGVIALAITLLLSTFSSTDETARPQAGKFWVYIGTYTGGKSKGIYVAEFDASTGKLSAPQLAAEITSPSFLAIHPNQKLLYSVGEISDFNKKRTGAVNAFALDPSTGQLTLLNQQESGGAGPCHIVVDKTGKHVLVANYGAGSCASLPIQEGGKLGPATSVMQHKGSSVNKARQEGPHAHSINLDAKNQFAMCADLGLDQVLIYKFDAEKGTLTKNDPPYVELAPGAGPRHFAFHPSKPFAFVINELDSTLTAMSYDADKGSFKKLQTVPTLKEPVKGNSTAEVVVHPSGKFVYGSNRGHNSIVCYQFDAEKGELKYVAHQGKDIKIPRNFNIEPTGQYLFVANQDGDSVIVFKIHPETGELTPTDQKIEVGKPVCVKFLTKK